MRSQGSSIESGRVRVVTGENPSPAERFAAAELAAALEEMAGAPVPADSSPRDGESFRLMVGDGAAGQISGPPPALAENESEARRLGPDALLLRGGGSAATLHAVYELLDRLGCRWFHPEERLIPRRREIPFPEEFRCAPSFEYRELLWKAALEDGDWACRNRINGSLHALEEKHGGRWGWDPYVHSFYRIVPPERHGKEHPEYFAYRHGQGHLLGGAQLCLSHPDVLRIATDFVLAQMAQPDIRIVDVSQMDCANPCQCPLCEAKDRKVGSHAGSLLEFANAIAETTARHYPGKYISTLAYTYTQAPPAGLTAHPNVIVRLCHMEPSCDAHPLDDCPHNAFYTECLEQWCRICRRVYVWHYSTNFLHNLAFHPNLHALARDVRFYRDVGVKGIFFQGQPRHGVAFAELEAFVQARLAWNADRDLFEEAAAFCGAYYGSAGPAILEMLGVLHENALAGFHSHLYTHPSEGTFTPGQLNRAQECLAQAFEAAGQEEKLRNRLELVRLWMSYTRLTSIPPICANTNQPAVIAPEGAALFRATAKGMADLGVGEIREFPSNHQDLDERLGWARETHDLGLLALENGRLRIEVCPELAGMVYTLQDRATGRDLACKPAPWILRYPYMGGLTEGCMRDGFGPGFMCSFAVKDASAERIVLAARLANGISVERTFTLEADRLLLCIRSGYRNDTAQPLAICHHSFATLSLGALADVRFFRRTAEGHYAKVDAVFPDGRTTSAAQWVALGGENLPAGVWGCFNEVLGIGVQQDLGGIAVAHCGSNGYARDHRVLLESVGQEATLAPGDERLFEHRYALIHGSPAALGSRRGR